MLTRNFYSMVYSCMTSSWPTIGVAVDGTVGKTLTTSFDFTSAMKNGTATLVSNSSSSACVAFGSGTTPATPNDYTLEAQITSKLTIANPSKPLTNITDEYLEYTSTFGIQSTEDKVISEIGLFLNINSNILMIDRTVLETPIEIPAGQSKQVTYTIRINYPTV